LSQVSIRRRAIESRRGSLKRSSSGEARTIARVSQRADSISLVSGRIALSRASAVKPIMIEEGKGQGCEE